MAIVLPTNCPECHKLLKHLEKSYQEGLETGTPYHLVLDDLGLTKYCCRRTLALLTVLEHKLGRTAARRGLDFV